MINAVTVCVEYSDYLKYTLPYNRDKFEGYVVVTTPTDTETIAIAMQNNCVVLTTTSFYENAIFNKWIALEEGLEQLGRIGDICILDADVVIPKAALMAFPPGNLVSPKRYLMEQFSGEIPRERDWKTFPTHPSTDFDGYMQMFNANDPVLGSPPWHETNWIHAGGADTMFQNKWPSQRKIRPDWRVLHLGPCGTNWCGRISPHVETRQRPHDSTWRKRKIIELMEKRRANKNYDAEKQ